MTDQMTPLDGFEQRLLTELRAEISAAPEPVARPALARRRRYLLAGAAALVIGGAAAVAGPVVLGSSHTSAAAAYTVTTRPDGTVSVVIHRWTSAAGLERALAERGVRARVAFLPSGKRCAWSNLRQAALPRDIALRRRLGTEGPWRFTLDPAVLAGNTLLFEATAQRGGARGTFGRPASIRLHAAQGRVAPCRVVDAR